MVVSNQVNSSIKYGVSQKFVLKKKGPYRDLEKATPSSYWLQCLIFLGSREARKKSEGISSQYGKDTIHHGDPQACKWIGHHIFHHIRTIGEKYCGRWIGVVIRGAYQEASKDIRWSYEPVVYWWKDVLPGSDSSVDGSIDEGSKYQ